MTAEIVFILALLAISLTLFALELLPIEVTALLVLATLLATGSVTPAEAFSGFSNKAVVAIGALFVLSHALTKTGLVARGARALAELAGSRQVLGIGALLATVAVLSGFLNNTAIVAIFIPLVIDFCARLKISPSLVLMPLSYASIFGGTLTLIGTSTNLIVSSMVQDAGAAPIGMFELLPLGLIVLVLGLSYVIVAAPRLLPDRVRGDVTGRYGLGTYLTEVQVAAGSELVGKTSSEADLGARFGINVLAVIRGDERLESGVGTLRLAEGDLLIVNGSVDQLFEIGRQLGVALVPEVKLTESELTAGALATIEVLLAPGSALVGRTVADAEIRSRYGGVVMAIRRHAETVRDKVARTVLRPWDALLTLIPRERLELLRQSDDFIVLTELPVTLRRHRLWWLVLVVLPAAVGAAALGALEISAAALVGAVVVLAAGTVTPREAYDSINWSVIFLIAAFVPVGQVVVDSGAADYLAQAMLEVAALLPVEKSYAVLALLYLATSLLTQMVSNAAAAIITVPIAISVAAGLGVDSRPFIIAICFAASAEFMTPMGYQTNLMVYAPGAYRFLDYTRFGAPLNLTLWITATLLIPRIWSF